MFALQRIFRALWGAALYLWQLPQNILGDLLLICFAPCRLAEGIADVRVFVSGTMRGGISLGRVILLSEANSHDRKCVMHEYGHCRQSRMLGWLYLPLIGLPSVLWAALHSHVAPDKSYYRFYTERWADRLGGIER